MCWENDSGETGWIIMEWEMFFGVRSERKRRSSGIKVLKSKACSLVLAESMGFCIPIEISHGAIYNQPQLPKKPENPMDSQTHRRGSGRAGV